MPIPVNVWTGQLASECVRHQRDDTERHERFPSPWSPLATLTLHVPITTKRLEATPIVGILSPSAPLCDVSESPRPQLHDDL